MRKYSNILSVEREVFLLFQQPLTHKTFAVASSQGLGSNTIDVALQGSHVEVRWSSQAPLFNEWMITFLQQTSDYIL